MLGVIALASAAAGTIVPWLLDRAEEIEASEQRAINDLSRTMAGKTASDTRGPSEEVTLDEYILVPADPAFGGREVLMTHEEFSWWVLEGAAAPELHIRKIRGILASQEDRWEEERLCGAH